MKSDADIHASLFIYYKLAGTCATEALQRLAVIQAGLVASHPGLIARMLARSDEQGIAEPTWMEIYEHPHGLSEAFLTDLQAAVASLPPGLIGPRHTESFSEFRLPAGDSA